MQNSFKILELRTNEDACSITSASYATFDVKLTLATGGPVKWVSVPHELFFEYLICCNPNLYDYIENFLKGEPTEIVVYDLLDLGYDFEPDLLQYIEAKYSKEVFKILPSYDPDFTIGHSEGFLGF